MFCLLPSKTDLFPGRKEDLPCGEKPMISLHAAIPSPLFFLKIKVVTRAKFQKKEKKKKRRAGGGLKLSSSSRTVFSSSRRSCGDKNYCSEILGWVGKYKKGGAAGGPLVSTFLPRARFLFDFLAFIAHKHMLYGCGRLRDGRTKSTVRKRRVFPGSGVHFLQLRGPTRPSICGVEMAYQWQIPVTRSWNMRGMISSLHKDTRRYQTCLFDSRYHIFSRSQDTIKRIQSCLV